MTTGWSTRYRGRVLAEARCISMRGGGLLNAGTLAVSAAIAAARSAAVKVPVVRQNSTRFSLGILGVDRVAPAVVDLEDVAIGREPALLPASELVRGRNSEGDVVDEVGHAGGAGEVRLETLRSRYVVQLPEGDEPRIVAVHPIEEVLRPPAVGNGGDLDLHQLEAHHLLVEVMDCGHVARREREMMVAHVRSPLRNRPCASHPSRPHPGRRPR